MHQDKDTPTRPSMDLHRGMDVYTMDYHYIGQVSRVIINSQRREPSLPFSSGNRQAPPHTISEAPDIHDPRWGTRKLTGEDLGPAPTASAGNSGPLRQSSAAQYATGDESGSEIRPDGYFIVSIGPFGLYGQLSVPFDAVYSIAAERVLLACKKADLPHPHRFFGSASLRRITPPHEEATVQTQEYAR
jgi:hypothetical protein